MYKLLIISFFLITQAEAVAQNIKIITYNIRLDVASDGENNWDHRKDFLAAQIQFYEPDIFGTQESQQHQVEYLTQNLPEYSHIGLGRDENGGGESTSVFYKKNRFDVNQPSTFWLSETPDRPSKGWDAAVRRICTFALFFDKTTNQNFWVFNTHLDHRGVEARGKGVALILEKMKEVNKQKLPVIFMGDFNAEPDEAVIQNLRKVMNDTRIVSEGKPFGPSGTFNGFEFAKPVTKLIDYIFVKQISVKKYAVLSDSNDLRYPSDHLPVYVELFIPSK